MISRPRLSPSPFGLPAVFLLGVLQANCIPASRGCADVRACTLVAWVVAPLTAVHSGAALQRQKDGGVTDGCEVPLPLRRAALQHVRTPPPDGWPPHQPDVPARGLIRPTERATRGSATAPEAGGHGLGSVQRVVRRSVGRAADGGGRHRCLVGPRHPRARDHVGRGGTEAPAAHPEGRHAAPVLRSCTGASTPCQTALHDGKRSPEPVAVRGSRAAGGDARLPRRSAWRGWVPTRRSNSLGDVRFRRHAGSTSMGIVVIQVATSSRMASLATGAGATAAGTMEVERGVRGDHWSYLTHGAATRRPMLDRSRRV